MVGMVFFCLAEARTIVSEAVAVIPPVAAVGHAENNDARKR
jgi:hypothetical protein